MRHERPSLSPDPRPALCAVCSGQEFEPIGVGMWDGVNCGIFYEVRCLNCRTFWEAHPTHEELNAGKPLVWRPNVTHDPPLQRTATAVKRSWFRRLFDRGPGR